MRGRALFSRHSHPVGLTEGNGSIRLAISFQTELLCGSDLRLSGLFAGLAMAMGSEVVELGIDLRQTAGIGAYELVDFGFAQTAAITNHGGGFRAEVLFGGALNALSLEGMPRDAFRHPGFSQSAIAANLPHLSNPLDLLRAKFAVIEFTDFPF